jgi:hypothetical protein
VNETKEGVVKLPCSLATARTKVRRCTCHWRRARHILISTLVPS